MTEQTHYADLNNIPREVIMQNALIPVAKHSSIADTGVVAIINREWLVKYGINVKLTTALNGEESDFVIKDDRIIIRDGKQNTKQNLQLELFTIDDPETVILLPPLALNEQSLQYADVMRQDTSQVNDVMRVKDNDDDNSDNNSVSGLNSEDYHFWQHIFPLSIQTSLSNTQTNLSSTETNLPGSSPTPTVNEDFGLSLNNNLDLTFAVSSSISRQSNLVTIAVENGHELAFYNNQDQATIISAWVSDNGIYAQWYSDLGKPYGDPLLISAEQNASDVFFVVNGETLTFAWSSGDEVFTKNYTTENGFADSKQVQSGINNLRALIVNENNNTVIYLEDGVNLIAHELDAEGNIIQTLQRPLNELEQSLEDLFTEYLAVSRLNYEDGRILAVSIHENGDIYAERYRIENDTKIQIDESFLLQSANGLNIVSVHAFFTDNDEYGVIYKSVDEAQQVQHHVQYYDQQDQAQMLTLTSDIDTVINQESLDTALIPQTAIIDATQSFSAWSSYDGDSWYLRGQFYPTPADTISIAELQQAPTATMTATRFNGDQVAVMYLDNGEIKFHVINQQGQVTTLEFPHSAADVTNIMSVSLENDGLYIAWQTSDGVYALTVDANGQFGEIDSFLEHELLTLREIVDGEYTLVTVQANTITAQRFDGQATLLNTLSLALNSQAELDAYVAELNELTFRLSSDQYVTLSLSSDRTMLSGQYYQGINGENYLIGDAFIVATASDGQTIFNLSAEQLADGGFIVNWLTTADANTWQANSRYYDAEINPSPTFNSGSFNLGDESQINGFYVDGQVSDYYEQDGLLYTFDGETQTQWSVTGPTDLISSVGSVNLPLQITWLGAGYQHNISVDPLALTINQIANSTNPSLGQSSDYTVVDESVSFTLDNEQLLIPIHDSNGLLVNVWQETVAQGGDIKLQFFYANGRAVDLTLDNVNESATTNVSNLSVTRLNNGSFAVSWLDDQQIYLKIYTPNGETFDSQFIHLNSGMSAANEMIAGQVDDNIVIIWLASDGSFYESQYDSEGQGNSGVIPKDPKKPGIEDFLPEQPNPLYLSLTESHELRITINEDNSLSGQVFDSDTEEELSAVFTIKSAGEDSISNVQSLASNSDDFTYAVTWQLDGEENSSTHYIQQFNDQHQSLLMTLTRDLQLSYEGDTIPTIDGFIVDEQLVDSFEVNGLQYQLYWPENGDVQWSVTGLSQAIENVTQLDVTLQITQDEASIEVTVNLDHDLPVIYTDTQGNDVFDLNASLSTNSELSSYHFIWNADNEQSIDTDVFRQLQTAQSDRPLEINLVGLLTSEQTISDLLSAHYLEDFAVNIDEQLEHLAGTLLQVHDTEGELVQEIFLEGVNQNLVELLNGEAIKLTVE